MMIDSYAWVEFFNGTPSGAAVEQHLRQSPVVYTCPIVLAEVQSKFRRNGQPELAEHYGATIIAACAVIPTDEDQAQQAAIIHAEQRQSKPTFGLADALILAAARSADQPVLTGDPHFQGIPDALLLDEP